MNQLKQPAPTGAESWDVCVASKRADGKHGFLFDGDDPYVVCVWCAQRRDNLTGKIIGETPAPRPAPEPSALLPQAEQIRNRIIEACCEREQDDPALNDTVSIRVPSLVNIVDNIAGEAFRAAQATIAELQAELKACK